MNEISVKTLYPDGSTSPYRAIALPAFASLCLMTGALLVLFAHRNQRDFERGI